MVESLHIAEWKLQGLCRSVVRSLERGQGDASKQVELMEAALRNVRTAAHFEGWKPDQDLISHADALVVTLNQQATMAMLSALTGPVQPCIPVVTRAASAYNPTYSEPVAPTRPESPSNMSQVEDVKSIFRKNVNKNNE